MAAGPVLIAYDGSDLAEHAVREAAAVLAQRRVLVVCVWEEGMALIVEPTAIDPGGGVSPIVAPIDMRAAAEIDDTLADRARRIAQHGAEIARQLGFDAEGLAVADEPGASIAKTLVQLATERDAPAIVVGAHGHGRLAKLLGSTSRDVLHHSTRPVLVVRKQPDEH